MPALRWPRRNTTVDSATRLEQKLSERYAQLAKLTERVNEIEHKLALANKQIVGPKTERMPTPEEEAKKREGHKPARGEYTNPKKRKENAEAMASLPATFVPHPVPDEQTPMSALRRGDQAHRHRR